MQRQKAPLVLAGLFSDLLLSSSLEAYKGLSTHSPQLPTGQGWKHGWRAQIHLQLCPVGNSAHTGGSSRMKTQTLRAPGSLH